MPVTLFLPYWPRVCFVLLKPHRVSLHRAKSTHALVQGQPAKCKRGRDEPIGGSLDTAALGWCSTVFAWKGEMGRKSLASWSLVLAQFSCLCLPEYVSPKPRPRPGSSAHRTVYLQGTRILCEVTLCTTGVCGVSHLGTLTHP